MGELLVSGRVLTKLHKKNHPNISDISSPGLSMACKGVEPGVPIGVMDLP